MTDEMPPDAPAGRLSDPHLAALTSLRDRTRRASVAADLANAQKAALVLEGEDLLAHLAREYGLAPGTEIAFDGTIKR